jgi:hypothetical protein
MHMQLQRGAGRWWFKLILAQRGDDNQILKPANLFEQSFEYETGLSRSQQERARAALRELGVLQEKYARVPRRLEYMIDLDRLSNLSREWSDATERTAARPEAQDNAAQNVESSVTGSEPERPSKESIKIYPEKSSGENALQGKCSQRPHLVHPDAAKAHKKSATSTLEAGVHCFNDGDRERAKALIVRYGEQEVATAAKFLENKAETPYPSRVHKVLVERNSLNSVEVTSAFLEKIHKVDTKRKAHAAARKIAQQLPVETTQKYLKIYVNEKNGQGIISSLDSVTGKFSNLAEKLQFDRWLEDKIIGSNGTLS